MKNLSFYVKIGNPNISDGYYLKEITYQKLNQIYRENINKYVLERYYNELNSIIENNFAEYYIAVYLISKKVKKDGQVMILRGTQTSSLITYLLEISYIDPLEYNLPFETFAGIDGKKVPNFEFEFAEDYINIIYEFAEKTLKEKNILCTKNEFFADNSILKLNFFENNYIDLLNNLEETTKINHNNIKINDINICKCFSSEKNIIGFESNKAKEIIDKIQPVTLEDLIKIESLVKGTWKDNIEKIIGKHSLNEVLCTRDDIFLYLYEKGIEKRVAFEISEFIGKGKINTNKSKWNEYKTIMKRVLIEDLYLESFEKIMYLFPKSHCITYVIFNLWLFWYEMNYPKL